MRLLLSLLLLAATVFLHPPAMATADELAPEHPPALPAYGIGDRVTVVDAAGGEFVATLTGYDPATGKVTVAIDEEPFAFPLANVVRKAGFWERIAAAYTEKSQRVATLVKTGLTVLALSLANAASGEVDIGGDDDPKVDTSTAQAQAQAAAQLAEQRTLENGPSTPVRYQISGTFSGPVVSGFTGEWTPSITFGAQASARGGSIAAFTLPPKAVGEAPQVVENLGAWSTTGEGQVLIEGTAPSYDGRASLTGAPAPGAAASRSVVLGTRSGLNLSGGSVAAFEVEP